SLTHFFFQAEDGIRARNVLEFRRVLFRSLYDRVIDLTAYSFSWRALWRRFRASGGVVPRWMHLLRSVSSEGFGRLRYYREVRRQIGRASCRERVHSSVVGGPAREARRLGA